MKSTRIFYIFFLLFPVFELFSQNCTPQSKFSAEVPYVTASTFSVQLSSLPNAFDVFYDQHDVDDVYNMMRQCNQQMGIELAKVDKERRTKIAQINDLLEYGDIFTIRNAIQQLEKDKAETLANLDKSLTENAPRGLFLVLLKDINIVDKLKLQSAALAAIGPYAVNTLRGTRIERITKVVDLVAVEDLINSYTSGQTVPVGGALYDPVDFKNHYYLYLARIDVKLLKKSLDATQSVAQGSPYVFNLELDTDYESALLAKGVIRDHIDDIKKLAQEYQKIIVDENALTLETSERVSRETEDKVKRYNAQIVQKKLDLRSRAEKIKSFCNSLGLPFDSINPDKSATAAKTRLLAGIAEIEKRRLDIQDREIFTLSKPEKGDATIDPLPEIAAKIAAAGKKLEGQAGLSFEVEEFVKVRNLQTEEAFSSNKVKYVRRLQRVWAFPVGGSSNDFEVHIFGQCISVRGWDTLPPMPSGMVLVKGGTFTMGCSYEQAGDCRNDELPVHKVTLSDFYIGKTEVTVAEFKEFMDKSDYLTDAEKEGNSYVYNGSTWELKNGVSWRCDASGKSRPSSDYNHPVIHVSWNDAVAYCQWFSEKTGKSYRLPTEAEWEYAARGGKSTKNTKYAGSDDVGEVAWYSPNTNDTGTKAVGQKKPNELGLNDMSGNVWEWCADWYADKYTESSQTNPTGLGSGSFRVLRGGSWDYDAGDCRVSSRISHAPEYRLGNYGFRLCSSPQ
jgi:formylglycine-generating enzyme required for sulfatase activity